MKERKGNKEKESNQRRTGKGERKKRKGKETKRVGNRNIIRKGR